MFWAQDGTYCHGPQPLGVFSKTPVYPEFEWHGHDIVENVLGVSKTGLLMGLVDARNTSQASEDNEWAVGLRLARFAV